MVGGSGALNPGGQDAQNPGALGLSGAVADMARGGVAGGGGGDRVTCAGVAASTCLADLVVLSGWLAHEQRGPATGGLGQDAGQEQQQQQRRLAEGVGSSGSSTHAGSTGWGVRLATLPDDSGRVLAAVLSRPPGGGGGGAGRAADLAQPGWAGMGDGVGAGTPTLVEVSMSVPFTDGLLLTPGVLAVHQRGEGGARSGWTTSLVVQSSWRF